MSAIQAYLALVRTFFDYLLCNTLDSNETIAIFALRLDWLLALFRVAFLVAFTFALMVARKLSLAGLLALLDEIFVGFFAFSDSSMATRQVSLDFFRAKYIFRLDAALD